MNSNHTKQLEETTAGDATLHVQLVQPQGGFQIWTDTMLTKVKEQATRGETLYDHLPDLKINKLINIF